MKKIGVPTHTVLDVASTPPTPKPAVTDGWIVTATEPSAEHEAPFVTVTLYVLVMAVAVVLLATNDTVLPVPRPLLHTYEEPPVAVSDTVVPGHTVAEPTTPAVRLDGFRIVND